MISKTPLVRKLASAAVVAAVLCAPVLHAASEDMARTIQDALFSVPSLAGDSLTVRIVDGEYVIAGLVDGIDARNDVREALEGIEGLDMSLLVNNVVVQ